MIEFYNVLSQDWQNIKNQPIKFSVDMYIHLKRKTEELEVWQMWLAVLPNMDEKTYVDFETYKNRILNRNTEIKNKRTTEEILEEARVIRKSLGREV